MTATRTWLEARRRELGRRDIVAASTLTAGLVLVALAVGLVLARIGFYSRFPEAVVVAWLAALGALGWSVIRYQRTARARAHTMLASEIEAAGGLRRGSLAGVADERALRGSSDLAALADAHAAAWLDQHGRGALSSERRKRSRAVQQGAFTAIAGAALFAAAGPGADSGATFWRPFSLIARAHGPIRINVDHQTVARGGRVMVEVVAAGRPGAELYERAPGEPWRRTPLTLDDSGRAIVPVGPLETDRYFHAASGGRFSDTIHVAVRLPAFLSELQLLARYPTYLARGDEPLAPGPDTILLPVGTQILTTGQATVPLGSAGWWSGPSATSPSATLRVRDGDFSGALTVARSGSWRLVVSPHSGDPLESPAPELHIIAVPDSAPVVTIPIPGVDTIAPVSLKQALVIDAHDDNLLTRVELVSRRVSRLGISSDPVTEVLALPVEGIERTVLQHVLDLDGRGFLPGDTAYYRVRAADNRPGGQWGESREFILRLPSLAEQREAVRQAAQALAAGVDSLSRAQRELTQKTEDIAAERDRSSEASSGANRPPPGQTQQQQMQFRSAERANEVAEQQSKVLDRADELRAELKELSREAWDAGLTDPQWQEQLRQLEKLLDQAITPELEERLKQLRDALERLDAPAAREALKQLAEAQKQLREELERSRELFERAALEGAMSSLAQDAEELARRQQEWNKAAERSVDSAMAREERELAKMVDSLAKQLAGLDSAFKQTGADSGSKADSATQQAAQQAQQASNQMQQAAQQAQQGNQQQAQRSGEQAQKNLDPMANQLRQAQQGMRDEWRREVMESLDKALTETADLAKRQQEVSERLNRGESGADVRGQQAALRDGVDRVMERLQEAAGKNALVSPRLSTAMGFAKLRMGEALQELEQGSPNARRSAESAGEAVDGLNAVAYGLMRSRSDVQGAESGSGFAEAVQRMAELAQQQNALNGQASGLLPMMQQAGQTVMQELQALANQQRMLAQELERMRAEGQLGGAGALAEEARELARQLEAGRLDRATVERQERLFRRLLDAGRTLQGEEEEEEKERQSTTAKDGNVRPPDARGVNAGGPKYPYPTWEELRRMSPEERRLILDYFRRLNEKRP